MPKRASERSRANRLPGWAVVVALVVGLRVEAFTNDHRHRAEGLVVRQCGITGAEPASRDATMRTS